MRLALLHPGAMGATIGATLVASGHEVHWLRPDRSQSTAGRAMKAGLTADDSLADLLHGCEGLISVCPPSAAVAVAETIVAEGYAGVYLDANAIAPATARTLHQLLGERFVDGGIIGPPAHRPGTTRLYLSGEPAAAVADWFTDDRLGVHMVPGAAGSASALKMCYAAYTKGTSALLLAIRALARAEGVDESLQDEWRLSQPELGPRSESAGRSTAGKAWRFVGEMEEIAATFEARDLPGGFHHAAGEIYRRISDLKDVADPDLAAVIRSLLSEAD